MQRVLVLMNLILGFCRSRPQRKEDHKTDVSQNVVYTFVCTVDDAQDLLVATVIKYTNAVSIVSVGVATLI